MLETGQAHACHRFVIEDALDEEPRLLVRPVNLSTRALTTDQVREGF